MNLMRKNAVARTLVFLLIVILAVSLMPVSAEDIGTPEDEETVAITLHYNAEDCTVRVYDGNKQSDPMSGLFVTGDGQTVRIPKSSWTVYEIYNIRDGYRIGHVTMNGEDRTEGFINGAYGGMSFSGVKADVVFTAEMEPIPEVLPSITKVTVYLDSTGNTPAPENMTFGDDFTGKVYGIAEYSDGVKYPNYYDPGQWQYSTDGVNWYDTRSWGRNRYDFLPKWPYHDIENEIDYLHESYDLRLKAVPRDLYATGDPVYSNVIHVNGGAKVAPLTVTEVTPSSAAAKTGETITWTASAAGGIGTLQYCFYLYRDGAIIQKTGYGSAASARYTAAEAGIYQAKVFVKDSAGSSASSMSGKTTVQAAAAPLEITGVTLNATGTAPGATLTWTASAAGGSGTLRYNFYIYQDGAVIQKTGYTTAKTASWTAADAGKYSVKVYVKDAAGTVVTQNSGSTVIANPAAPLAVSSVAADKTSAAPGETITWTAAATGGTGTLRYNFYIYKDGAVIRKTGYTTAKTASWTAADAGKYSVKVYVKDAAAAVVTQSGGIVTVAAPAGPLAVTGITADKTGAAPGDTITWTAAAAGGSGALRYCFYVYKDGAVVQKTGYGSAASLRYTAAEAGRYQVKVFVKDSTGAAVSAMSGNTVVGADAGSPLTVAAITADKTSAAAGDTITWTASASGSGTLRYCFYVYRDGAVVQKTGYGTAKTLRFTADSAGVYQVKVFVKDAAGAAVSRMSAKLTVTG